MNYPYAKTVNRDKLQDELTQAGFANDGITADPTSVIIHFTEDLSELDQIALTTLINNHVPSLTLRQYAAAKRKEAEQFGQGLICEFVDENIMLGITALGLTNKVRKVTFQIADALRSGSLYDAIDEVTYLNPADFDANILTAARLLAFRNKIHEYLEIEPAESWDTPRG